MDGLGTWWRSLTVHNKAFAAFVILDVVLLTVVVTQPRSPSSAIAGTTNPTARPTFLNIVPAPTARPTATTSPVAPITPAPITPAPITPAPTIDIWTREVSVGLMEALGFSGIESPLLDGTPRWLGRGPNSSIAEVIGDPTVTGVSVTVIAGADGGRLAGEVLTTWLPESMDWFQGVLGSYSGTDIDKSLTVDAGTLRVQTLTAVGGALVIVSIDR